LGNEGRELAPVHAEEIAHGAFDRRVFLIVPVDA